MLLLLRFFTARTRRLRGIAAASLLLAALLVGVLLPAGAASTGQILGTVVDSKTKEAIAGARVVATSPSGTYSAKTDEKGAFSIAGVVLDTYTISVQFPGYDSFSVAGATVTADEGYRLTVTLSRALRTIGSITTRGRSITSPFQPTQTVDRYTVNSAGIDQLLGKSNEINGTKLLSELPSVTVDRNGTPLIRGGTAFETSEQVEGIDVTLPSRSVTNQYSNSGNGFVLNGVGSLELVPGGGDATHGDTGTGLIAFTVKRGTNPGFDHFDYETALTGEVQQYAFEDGRTFGSGSRLSNYFSIISNDTGAQYGIWHTDPRAIGASALTPDPNANSNINAHTGSLWVSAFYNTARTYTSDYLDNLVYKFGHNGTQSLQLFLQHQYLYEPQNYGGLDGLTFPLVGQDGTILNVIAPANFGPQPTPTPIGAPTPIPTPMPTTPAAVLASRVYGQYPGAVPGAPITTNDYAQSNLTLFKAEYNNSLNATTALGLRYYELLSDQQQFQASQGLIAPLNGGTRRGFSGDLTKIAFGNKDTFQIGGKFEFARPYGTVSDYIDYLPAYGDVQLPYTQIATKNPVSPIPDFVIPNAATTGCRGTPFAPTSGNAGGTYLCGYLAHFFGSNIPALPPETEIPTATQQSYSLYAQDTYSPVRTLKILAGLRLDGYNFQLPSDPSDPPAVDGIRHQRLYEPHTGISWQFRPHDAIRFNFGRTLSIPLPTFLGLNIDRSAYDAFNNVPSYDNTKGPFDPTRPLATQADYCGPGAITSSNASQVVLGTQPCASYADQLYWLTRNYRFSEQNLITSPLRGATFTNYDLSYSHEFGDGTALKLTPFYRRGYDVVEATRTLLGWDPTSEVPALSPEIYSNLGSQSAAGIEFDLAKARQFGLSYQLTATYINQIGNDPPGSYIPTASVQLGEYYHSPTLAPFQSALGLTYRLHDGLKINPVFRLRSGYPYGAGVYYALNYNGQAIYVPLTDALVEGYQGVLISNTFVNPQNPGTVTNPNTVAGRGTEKLTSGPGSLLSSPALTTDLTIEIAPPGKSITYGVTATNLFNQLADIPVVNVTNLLLPSYNGRYVYGGSPTASDPSHTTPLGIPNAYAPYIIFPNQQPLLVRFYVQAKI
jgi:hypothetical protein